MNGVGSTLSVANTPQHVVWFGPEAGFIPHETIALIPRTETGFYSCLDETFRVLKPHPKPQPILRLTHISTEVICGALGHAPTSIGHVVPFI